MGQKVHPIGFRLGIYVPHKSIWFVDKKSEFPVLLNQDFKIREYIKKNYKIMSYIVQSNLIDFNHTSSIAWNSNLIQFIMFLIGFNTKTLFYMI